jgi:hypothetical protein
MTPDDIIRMAREAYGDWFPNTPPPQELERFAALVAAAEREACAKVCDEMGNSDTNTHAWDAAAAIRARGADE